jgi:type II secretory pathway pseudopilin PulG
MRRQQGFSYVVVMFLVAILSIIAVRALETTSTAERRDKEVELLWRGMAYRDAILDYYVNAPGTAQSYPQKLNDLLYDSRFTIPRRHLRKLYRDPMVADGEWELVRNDAGDLIGVRSRSTLQPLKRSGFPEALATFTNASHYSDWKFVYQQPH